MYQTDDEGKKNLIRRRQNYISTKSGAAKSMSDEKHLKKTKQLICQLNWTQGCEIKKQLRERRSGLKYWLILY